MKYDLLILLFHLIITSLAVTNVFYPATLTGGMRHIANLTGNSFVNINFEVISSPNFTYTVVFLSWYDFLDLQPKVSDFYSNAKAFTNQFADLEGASMGKKQYINLRKPSNVNQLLVSVYNMDAPNYRRNITFNLNISSSNGLRCQPCFTGTSTIGCSCVNCAFGYEGYDCSRKIVYLAKDATQFIRIIGYTPTYMRINASTSDYSFNILAESDNIQLYIRTIGFKQQYASYLNVDILSNQQQRYLLTNGEKLSLYYPASVNDISLTVVKYTSGQGSIQVQYSNIPSNKLTYILTIVAIIIGICVFIALTFLLYITWKRRRVNQLRNQNQPFNNNHQLLQFRQIEKYFPPFKLAQTNAVTNDLESFSELQLQQGNNQFNHKIGQIDAKQCSICLQIIRNDDLARVTYCRHFFHSSCLISWFRKQSSCPYCRCDFNRENLKVLYKQISNPSTTKKLFGIELVKAIISQSNPILQQIKEQ